MNFIDLAKKRYSSRTYQDKPVEEEKIIKILEAAHIAPSAANHQPWVFYIFKEKDNLLKIREVYHRDWFKQAPIVIVACADHNLGWIRASDNKDHSDIDLAISITHMILQATELGLGTCWICNFDVNKCREVLDLPINIEPVALIPVAYPNDSSNPERHQTRRKQLSNIVVWK
jgi:nitroreductase